MKLRLQVILMILTILGVTAFQSFWLKQTYDQESKTLSIKSAFTFRDAIEKLQVSKFKLDSIPGENIFVRKVNLPGKDSLKEEITVRLNEKKGIISTINIITRKANDSLLKNPNLKNGMFITKDQTLVDNKLELHDSHDEHSPARDHLFNILYGVDSLQQPLKLNEIDSAIEKQFLKQNITVPFKVVKIDSAYNADGIENAVSVGLAHPTTYFLELGNRFPYLLKHISLPVLLSVLLLAIMIISFFLLYKNLLQQRKLTAIKNEFIGNITHELKTPIATVSVAIEAMKRFNVLEQPERTKEYLDIAGQELDRLSLLVDKVLRLSMFENHIVELKYELFDLAALTREVIRSMQLQLEKTNTILNLQLSGLDFSINADRMHIMSVIYNLLDNAIKYRKDNPVINISITATEAEMILKVEDNGIGIDPVYKDKIFEKFFRVPQGNIHTVKGYGLGLSYAAHILERHNGSIYAESNGTNGTTFTIKLPRANGN